MILKQFISKLNLFLLLSFLHVFFFKVFIHQRNLISHNYHKFITNEKMLVNIATGRKSRHRIRKKGTKPERFS